MIRNYSKQDLQTLCDDAKSNARRRAHLNVHQTLDANVQKLFIATEPDTYMRPHKHPELHKWEFLTVLQGMLDLLVFDDAGRVIQRTRLSPDATRSVEISPDTFHCYVCMQPNTVVLEIKEGAYIPSAESDFGPWSPPENSEHAQAYVEWLRKAEEGDSSPNLP